MSITAERKKTIDFTTFTTTRHRCVIGPKDGDTDITPGASQGQDDRCAGVDDPSTLCRRNISKPPAPVKTYQTQDEANNDLAAGRLDYVQADASALNAFLAPDQGAACCEMKGKVPEDVEILGEGVGGGMRKEDSALKDKINVAIAAMAKAGKFEEITKKYPELVGKIGLPKP